MRDQVCRKCQVNGLCSTRAAPTVAIVVIAKCTATMYCEEPGASERSSFPASTLTLDASMMLICACGQAQLAPMQHCCQMPNLPMPSSASGFSRARKLYCPCPHFHIRSSQQKSVLKALLAHPGTHIREKGHVYTQSMWHAPTL